MDIIVGNSAEDGNPRNGWFVGHFMGNQAGLARTGDVEVKWGIHEANEGKDVPGVNRTASTVSILVSGLFEIYFPELDRVVRLTRPGDYVLWGPEIAHSSQAVEKSVVITVRWPSVEGDQYTPSHIRD